MEAQKPSVSERVCAYLHTLRFHDTPPASAAAGLQSDIVAKISGAVLMSHNGLHNKNVFDIRSGNTVL